MSTNAPNFSPLVLDLSPVPPQAADNVRITTGNLEEIITTIAQKKDNISESEARTLIKAMTLLFRITCENAGYESKKITALTTKFRDAGRRSAPWKATSSRVPGRPQDGSDGNRQNRWLLPEGHKFYANEVNSTFVEVKYMLEALSMQNAPICETLAIGGLFTPWLVEHLVEPGAYNDPIQQVPIDFDEFINDAKIVQSGHLVPLDRGGLHHPDNTFLMLFRSNQLQGNLTVSELLMIMEKIIQRHAALKAQGNKLEKLIQK